MWAVSAAIESLGAFNAETLGQIEYESVAKKHVLRRLEFHSRRINLLVEIFKDKLKPGNNWSKKLKSMARELRRTGDYPEDNEADAQWSSFAFPSKQRFLSNVSRPLLEKKYYELVTKEYQRYFRSITYVAEREFSGCRKLEPENVYLLLLQSDVEKLFRYVQIWDLDDNVKLSPIEKDDTGKPIVTEKDLAEFEHAVNEHGKRLDKLVEDYIPQLKDIECGNVPSFKNLAKTTSLMLNSHFGALLHIGENFFVLRASSRAFLKRAAMDNKLTDDSPLVYHGVGLKTREDRSIHTWARAIYLFHMLSLEALGDADKGTMPAFFHREQRDYNSDDDEYNVDLMLDNDEANPRRKGFQNSDGTKVHSASTRTCWIMHHNSKKYPLTAQYV